MNLFKKSCTPLENRTLLCYLYYMTITQTIEVPSNRHITLKVPQEIPTGAVILSFTPAKSTESITERLNSYYEKHDSSLADDIKAANYRLLREEDW